MKTLYTFIVSLLCILPVFAQQSVLLQKYKSMAVDYNHDLRAANKNIASSIELVKSARADLKPKLSGDANFQYTGHPLELNIALLPAQEPMTFEGSSLKYFASLSLMQPVYTGGRILESIRMAQYQQRLTAHQADLLFSSVCYQTTVLYWNTVACAELVEIATDYHRSIASLVKTIAERVEAGLTDRQDLLMVEVKLNEAHYRLLQAQSAFDTGLMALNSLIGVELKAPTEVEDAVPAVVLPDSLLLYDGSTRPELMVAREQIRIAQSTGKLTDSKYKPQLYIGVDGSYASPGYNFRTDIDPNYAVYAKLSVPLFQWGKRQNEKRAASWKVGMANDYLYKVTDGVNLEIQSAHTSLSQAMEQVRLTGHSLGKACDNERMAQERYNEGRVSIVELIEAKNYRQSSQIDYVQAKVSAQGYYSDLLKALHQY